ncbi:MAG: hypothetical protein F6K55_06180 [Moorea sp. SIO4A3]|nr:hypothetical protein [Moorena sp. SIO4A3]
MPNNKHLIRLSSIIMLENYFLSTLPLESNDVTRAEVYAEIEHQMKLTRQYIAKFQLKTLRHYVYAECVGHDPVTLSRIWDMPEDSLDLYLDLRTLQVMKCLYQYAVQQLENKICTDISQIFSPLKQHLGIFGITLCWQERPAPAFVRQSWAA